jgi:hypothetical protein
LLNWKKDPLSNKGKNNPFYGRKHDVQFVEDLKKLNSAANKGENNPNNKLSLNQCIQIKYMLLDAMPEKWLDRYKRIGLHFKVSDVVIRKIKAGTYWCSSEIGSYKDWIREANNLG